MEEHQLRVIDEKEALQKKIEALESFIKTNELFAGLDILEQDCLKAQLSTMKTYATILEIRITNFC